MLFNAEQKTNASTKWSPIHSCNKSDLPAAAYLWVI